MILSKARMSWLGLGALWALTSGLPAVADDTELFIGNSLGSQARPNILFVIDNSGSMGSLVLTQDGFDGSTTYPAVNGCDATRVYWRTGTGNPPTCDDEQLLQPRGAEVPTRAERVRRQRVITPTTWRSTIRRPAAAAAVGRRSQQRKRLASSNAKTIAASTATASTLTNLWAP